MADIRPFAAWHYNPDRFGRDWSSLIAPPYDVLGEQQLARLAGASEYNIVHVDVPHFPPGSAGPDAVYMAANRRLQAWIGEKALVRDGKPHYYHYAQTLEFEGGRHTRHSLLAVLRLSAFGTGEVYPHEQTFGGPIADRLKLMQATGYQLSPIFGLVRGGLHELLRRVNGSGENAWQADLNGVHHRLAPIADADLAAEISRALAAQPVYIADGHHRYKTAMAYRDWLRERQPGLPADHPANFVLLGLAGMQDPGNLLLPTHRIVEGLTAERLAALQAATGDMLRWKRFDGQSVEQWNGTLRAQGDKAFVFAAGQPAEAWLAVLTAKQLPARYASQRSDAFRELALAFLHNWLIDEVMAKDDRGPVRIRYTHDASEAGEAVNASTGAILVQACTMGELMAVSQANDTMPQKSTYFYPKLGTGLVLHSLKA